MITLLGMYDRPETAVANDVFWTGIRANLGFGPRILNRTIPFWDAWLSPDLLLAQTCGMPYRTALHGRVQLVGTPVYDLTDVEPGYYQSVFVTRKGDAGQVADYQDRVLAYNEATSQSGWAAPQNHAASLGFQFRQLFQSGSHVQSALAVMRSDADIAALDCVTWALISAHDDFADGLSVIQKTQPTPGLPLITANTQDAAAIFQAVELAIDALPQQIRRILMLKGIKQIPMESYLNVPNPASP